MHWADIPSFAVYNSAKRSQNIIGLQNTGEEKMLHSHWQRTLVKHVSPAQADKSTSGRASPGVLSTVPCLCTSIMSRYTDLHQMDVHSKHKRKAGISSGLCSHPPAKTSHSSQNPQPRVPGPAAPVLLRQSSSTAKKCELPTVFSLII